MLRFVKDVKSPKDEWENLKKIFMERKLQLQQEFNNVRQRLEIRVVLDYTLKVKDLCDLLGSINITEDQEEMVQICLEGLA